MAEGFDAGSIFVALRAQLDDFNKGIASAKDTLNSLGQASAETTVAFQELDTSVQVFTEIETAMPRVRTALQTVGAESRRTADSFREQGKAVDATEQTHQRSNLTLGRSANRIISVQLALLTLTQHGTGPAKDALQALSNGVSVATASFQLLQGKIGLVGAGIIGVGVTAISFFTRYLEDNIKKTDDATDAEERMRQRTEALSLAIQDANLAISVFGGTTADRLTAKLRLTESAFASNAVRIREISDELRKLKSAVDPNTALIGKLDQEKLNLNRQQDDIRKTGAFDKANSDVASLLQSTRDLNDSLANTEIAGQKAIQFGISQPAEVATQNLQASKAVLDKMIQDDLRIFDESRKYGLSSDQAAEILKQQHTSGQFDKARQDVLEKQAILERTKAVNDLAQTFSTAVGDGLRDAILNAKKPMEALAAVGQNLFGNMIDQTVKRLETGLTEAFKAITGAAGEGIGLAITGILGAAGAVLSRLSSKGSDNFAGVQSAVTSSQAVRGIVAGPSSVAIASVGDDLSRAVAPVVSRLDGVIGVLKQIASNTSGGRGGGLGSNVAISTP